MRIRGERAERRLGVPALPALCALLWVALVATTVVLARTAHLDVSACLLKRLTGVPCPSCGTTRGVLAMLHGHVAGALAWNPLFVPASLLIVALLAARLLFGIRFRLDTTPAARGVLLAAAATAVALNWAFVIAAGR